MTDNVFAPPRANLETREGPDGLWDIAFKEVRKLYLASVNIRALGVIYALGSLGLIVTGGTMVADPKLASAGSFVQAYSAILIVLGVLWVAGVITSFTRPRWGRWLGIVLCVLMLISFPFGTLIGILGLVAYVQGAKLFGPDRLLHKDVSAVYKLRKKDKQ